MKTIITDIIKLVLLMGVLFSTYFFATTVHEYGHYLPLQFLKIESKIVYNQTIEDELSNLLTINTDKRVGAYVQFNVEDFKKLSLFQKITVMGLGIIFEIVFYLVVSIFLIKYILKRQFFKVYVVTYIGFLICSTVYLNGIPNYGLGNNGELMPNDVFQIKTLLINN